MEVFCLRVSKSIAGKKFPFDRVYLVNYDDRAVIEKLFRYALVAPVEGALRTMLEEVLPDEYINRTFHRDDAENATQKISNDDWRMALFGEWLMVVPILPKWMNRNLPRYLAAVSWYAQRMGRGKKKVPLEPNPEPFGGRSYLLTPQKKIRPICVACPRMILHENGECRIGDKVCFETLPLSLVNHFEEGAALPDAPPNMNELEEYELLEKEEVLAEPVAANTRTSDLLRIIHE